MTTTKPARRKRRTWVMCTAVKGSGTPGFLCASEGVTWNVLIGNSMNDIEQLKRAGWRCVRVVVKEVVK